MLKDPVKIGRHQYRTVLYSIHQPIVIGVDESISLALSDLVGYVLEVR